MPYWEIFFWVVLTILGAGLYYWLEHPASIVGIIVTGVGLAGVLSTVIHSILKNRKRADASEPSTGLNVTQTVQGMQNAPVAVTGPGTVNINLPSSPAKQEKKIPRRSHLVYRGFMPQEIYICGWAGTGFTDRMNTVDSRAARAFIIKFENEYAQDGMQSGKVIAQLVYHLASGVKHRVDYGLWLNSPLRFLNMEVGETRSLVLFYEMRDRLVAPEDRRDGDLYFPDLFGYFRQTDISDLVSVDVTVLDQLHGPCLLHCGVSRDERGLYTVSVHFGNTDNTA